MVIDNSVHENACQQEVFGSGKCLFVHAEHPFRTDADAVEQVIQVDLAVRHTRRPSVTKQIVEPIHVQAAVNQLAELLVSPL